MTTADVPALSNSSAPGRWVLAITVLGSGIAALDATVVKPGPAGAPEPEECLHCGLEAPPLTSSVSQTAGAEQLSRRSPA